MDVNLSIKVALTQNHSTQPHSEEINHAPITWHISNIKKNKSTLSYGTIRFRQGRFITWIVHIYFPLICIEKGGRVKQEYR